MGIYSNSMYNKCIYTVYTLMVHRLSNDYIITWKINIDRKLFSIDLQFEGSNQSNINNKLK